MLPLFFDACSLRTILYCDNRNSISFKNHLCLIMVWRERFLLSKNDLKTSLTQLRIFELGDCLPNFHLLSDS